MMVRTTFEQVKYSTAKRVTCSSCGKAIRRQRTFTMTINPWNLNAAGEPASRSEIVEKLRAQAAAWLAEPGALCQLCHLRGRG